MTTLIFALFAAFCSSGFQDLWIMHPLYERADELSGVAIGAAIEVHRTLGPGLLESIYERCLEHELTLRGLACVRQQHVQVRYKDIVFEQSLKFDLAVESCLLIEVKAIQEVHPGS